MIPSRSLALVEIITETFSIFGRTFVRYALLFLVLLVPGISLLTAGTATFTNDFIASAKHDINFGDSDLTNARNDFNAYVSEQNPILSEKLPGAGQPHPHAGTRQLYYFLRTNFSRFHTSIELLAMGSLLFFIALFVLVAITVDLASQVFEERKQELFGSLRAAFSKHLWKILLLYLLYLIAVFILDGILGLIAAGTLTGLFLGVQFYLVLRLFATVPVLVSEEIGPFQAIVRSWRLTWRSGGRIFGAAFIFSVILFVGIMFEGLMLQFIFSDFSTWWNEILTRDHLTIRWLLESAPGALWAAAAEMTLELFFLLGLMAVFCTVLYYDLRTRLDGPLVYVDESS